MDDIRGTRTLETGGQEPVKRESEETNQDIASALHGQEPEIPLPLPTSLRSGTRVG